MCDVCADFLDLLLIFEEKVYNESTDDHTTLKKDDFEAVCIYIQSWSQRQCVCCFRDPKNFDRFYLLTRSIILLAVYQLKDLGNDKVVAALLKPPKPVSSHDEGQASTSAEDLPLSIKADGSGEAAGDGSAGVAQPAMDASPDTKKPGEDDEEGNTESNKTENCKTSSDIPEVWNVQDKEKLLHFLSKVFLANFPLYIAYKHSVHPKLDEITQGDASLLNSFCDLHDPDIPVYLLRNVCLFCKVGGLQAMMACFELTPETLPVNLAHAIIAIVCNLKQWLNFRATMQLFIPLRGKVLRYMCSLTDKDLRMPSVKSMADYMWSAVKDPLDAPVTFDRDGMDLAFKYFTSSTLTMRLAGISQINSHINLFNELCNNESIIDIENVGQHLAAWLIQNQIISHIFGPNLHVEVIKQSHIILSFLAMECKITNEHIDIIWQAAQLKHCSKQVHDLLPPLIKNLDGGPVLHLYNLLFKLEPKDHTEQSLYLASALIKFIWTSGGPYHLAGELPFVGLPKSALACLSARRVAEEMSSSENSVSMEASNSEDEQGGDSSPHKTASEDASDGPSPCKQSRKQRHQESSDESDKIDELEEEEEEEDEEDLKEMVIGHKAVSLKKVEHMSELCVKGERCQPTKESDNEADAEDNMEKVSAKKKVFRKHKKPVKCVADLCEVRTLIEECSEEDEALDQQVPCKASTEFLEGGAMSELASLVQRSPHEVHDCRPFLRTFQAHGELMDEMSADEGSYSSRMSNKSEKNMADFDGEDSGCEDELAQLAQVKAHALPQHLAFHARFPSSKIPLRHGVHIAEVTRILAQFKIENVCQPGNTLLWDLLQDDKITQLGDGLAIEAEKALCTLLCFNTERLIRMKFIEGCLTNLANNWSVVVSLRMLPKLFASFQQFRGMDTHHVTTWAEAEHNMMGYFFNNLQEYARKGGPECNLYTHQLEVQVRLQFLTSVFSPMGSSDNFKLSVDQVDTLWQCLATDPRCCDELFSWLLSQAKNKDGHALGPDSLKHLYLRKLPSLEPEAMSMTGLALFQQLCNNARMHSLSVEAPPTEVEVVGMDHLWRIALKANSTDVSMAAIQYLNGYYVGRQLDHEAEFVSQCMAHLAAATGDLVSAEESSLLCIQRALLLLKTHLETFKRRYAYHLRRWALEGQGVGSHVQLLGERGCQPIRIMIQPAGMVEKVTLELVTSDYVADLRAEVTKWWESLQPQVASDKSKELADGTIRMITQGQELSPEHDEKTLEEVNFKDMQIIFISMSASRQQKKRDSLDTPSSLPPPPRESLPTLLLLQPRYFEQLFTLMHTLSCMRTPHTKPQLLSRRVWDILTLLPTSPTLLRGFQQLDISLAQLLDPASPQKLMYSLYIVESLGRTKKQKEADSAWNHRFVQYGGLRHLFDIFMSGVLQRSGGGDGSEWQQDCLASLLKLLCQLGMALDEAADDEPPRNKRARKMRKNSAEKLVVLHLNDAMLQMMSADGVMPRLTSILQESSLPRDPGHYKTGLWGRAQVVHYAMALLASWVRSSECVVRQAAPHFASWLQRLALEDPEPAVRREVCSALYRLCLGGSKDFSVTAHMLGHLMGYLAVAEGMRPQKMEAMHHTAEDGKEPYGPACRDYFWLLCQLVDSLDDEVIKESSEESVDMDALAKRLSESILAREYLETRHNTVEDDGLIGLLNLACSVMKHNPPFKTSKQGQEFVDQVFDFLFALPDPRKRYVPKCKSVLSRSSAYDLLVELVKSSPDNYRQIHEKLLAQHKPGPHSPYPWDYWPHEDGRSDCGYVGLTNLGATCYMASCMQHLYMMPQARTAILRAHCDASSKHEATLGELQRMFAYLLESERKAYNPRSFCKVYTMDHQPLNTGEQKDMAEFFIDLVSKLEEMTPELKKLVKTLFGGVISNNVVSLDCDHVSRTLEEFYTVRCQVADMRNLYESLDEVTVKDTLEGDNMYTCSQCGKKVRAEKRACFKKLPHILCFNTMRYTFNMVTMLKEKVNTHFSFPLRLDMSGYVEKHLMPQRYQEEKRKSQLRKEGLKEAEAEDKEAYEYSDSEDFNECYEYDLIGVTVHTGTADGGHYYSFIRDRTTTSRDKWFLFNDAEVKPFDPSQIASECFGGEMTSKTYDSATDKFMDFSFEKTNSAYMLFYEWCSRDGEQRGSEAVKPSVVPAYPSLELSKELEDWIWQDNMHFLNDKNIFEHGYFNFMWQMCGYIPQTLISHQAEITGMAAQLSTSFFMESFIHAKEKPTMVQWVELLTKQFNASQAACEWFLDHMAAEDWWPMQILIKCPNQYVRQMFVRLCIHVIQRLRHAHAALYLTPDSEDSDDPGKIGTHSCVTRFVRMLLALMESGAKAHLKHLTEYFGFLYEFSKMGEEETQFLIQVRAISAMVNFYLGQKSQDYVEIVSEEEEEDDVIPLPTDKYKPASLEKMITLVAALVEKSRSPDHLLQISPADQSAIAGGKGFPFLYLQIKDNINLNQTRNLIFALCRWNDRLAVHIVSMIFQAISKHPELSTAFFKLLSLMTESPGGAGLPCFTQLVLHRVWEVAEYSPQPALDWLASQVQRNKLANSWVLTSMETWVEHFLIGHVQQRVRSAAANLLVCLVPSQHFKQAYPRSRSASQHKEVALCSTEALQTLHQVYNTLLRLLKPARHYTDVATHGTSKLTAYFALLSYCVVSRVEKLLFGNYFMDLWNLFHPKLSEPSISVHHNKQALLLFWHNVCIDCPENVQLILQNPIVTKNIAFNYILADHDDQEVVQFNRNMLPAYYGLLRLCCQQSRAFARQLSVHQNLQWAFKNITPHPTSYSAAVEELFKLIQLFLLKSPDCSEQELLEMSVFRRQTLQLYLQVLDGKACWATLVMALRTLIENDDDRLHVVYHGGLQMAFEAFHTLHVMYHEATACHVAGDLLELLSLITDMVKCLRQYRDNLKDVRVLLVNSKEWPDILRKLATLLNTYNVPEMRNLCIDLLKEILLIVPTDVIQTLVPLFLHCHAAFQEQQNHLPMGPYFPRRGQKLAPSSLKATSRPARPILQMAIPHNLEAAKGVDEEYDRALLDFYSPYHDFIDVMCRLAINHECMSESLVNLSAMIGFEGVLLHLTYFPKLWLDVFQAQPEVDRKFIGTLIHSHNLADYVETVLLDEKSSLNNPIIYNFLCIYFPKVAMHVLTEATCRHFETAVATLGEMVATMNIKTIASKLIGELRTFILVYRSEMKIPPPKQLIVILNQLSAKTSGLIQKPAEDLGSPSDDVSPKKVRIGEGNESPQVTLSSPGCSKEADKELVSAPDTTSNPAQTETWLEILEKTIVELKAVLTERKD